MGNVKKSRATRSAMWVLALVLLGGCAATGNGAGQVAALPPPPAQITPMTARAHQAALDDLNAHRASGSGYEAAVANLRKSADTGNPLAQFLLSTAYDLGEGAPHDAAEAARLLHAASLAGYPQAQTLLGDKYEHGDGVPQDQAMAYRWYEFAAAQGEDTGTGRLAYAMLNGHGMPRDIPRAMQLLLHCADPNPGKDVYLPSGPEGGPGCQAMLAAVYEKGADGIPPDDKKAVDWYTRSADRHMPLAEKHLAEFYESGRGVTQNGEAAAMWRKRAAEDAGKGPGSWSPL